MSGSENMSTLAEQNLILREAKKIVEALGQTFAPLCEVVLHDLRDPNNAIVKIENNLSGREVGGPATELGLARIENPDFPDLLVNYPNSFADGRIFKSTSIGLKDSSDKFVAAICINIDVSYLRSMTAYLNDFVKTLPIDGPVENLSEPKPPNIETAIQSFAASRNKDPRSLNNSEKRDIIRKLKEDGLLERRGATEQAAKTLGSSRSSIYYYLG
jgi:predicted transcriptional regulator YheO